MEDMSLPHLQSPPRSLGPGLTTRLLFGDFFSQFGWLFVAFGMLFVWIFDGAGGLVEAARFAGDPPVTSGEVTAWRSTSFNINSQKVFETSYEYRLPDGSTGDGQSYATGRYLDAGAGVTVEYLENDPEMSRIEGMRTTPGGLAVGFVFLLPFIGLVFAMIGMLRGLKAYRLLTIGALAHGTFEKKEATMTRVNNRPVMKLTFSFEAEGGGTFRATGKSHVPYRMEDEPTELIIYDPSEPARAMVLDEFGCQPRVDGRGAFEASRPGLPTALFLLLPGLSALLVVRYLASIL